MTDGQTIAVEVSAIERVTPLIKHFTLRRAEGGPLPAFSGGSHIIVVMRTARRVNRNPYSLLGSPADLDRYEIGVRRMEDSRGGSHFLHDEVAVGDRLEIAHPVNLFPLDKRARKHLLLAGGVGITPFLAQLEDLAVGTVPYELHYSVRSPDHAAFKDRLIAGHGGHVRLYHDSAGEAIDVEGLLSAQPLGTHVYVCGPKGMIDTVIDTARACGWSMSHIHCEQFSAPPVGDAFEVFLARSQRRLSVPPDQSLLEAIEAAGVEVPYLCRGGVCGFCRTRVLDAGDGLLHHDHFLSDAEKSGGKSLMPCVSRARGKHVVLDL
jgi:ferredoxin-NADP reductase